MTLLKLRSLYHVTTWDSYLSIDRTGGIDPMMAIGMRFISHYCVWNRIPWVIIEVMERKQSKLSQIVVLKVREPEDHWYANATRGLYQTVYKMTPIRTYGGTELLNRAILKGKSHVGKRNSRSTAR